MCLQSTDFDGVFDVLLRLLLADPLPCKDAGLHSPVVQSQLAGRHVRFGDADLECDLMVISEARVHLGVLLLELLVVIELQGHFQNEVGLGVLGPLLDDECARFFLHAERVVPLLPAAHVMRHDLDPDRGFAGDAGGAEAQVEVDAAPAELEDHLADYGHMIVAHDGLVEAGVLRGEPILPTADGDRRCAGAQLLNGGVLGRGRRRGLGGGEEDFAALHQKFKINNCAGIDETYRWCSRIIYIIL